MEQILRELLLSFLLTLIFEPEKKKLKYATGQKRGEGKFTSFNDTSLPSPPDDILPRPRWNFVERNRFGLLKMEVDGSTPCRSS